MDDLWLCGWRVRCELPLPDLWRWNGDGRQPDVDIRLGPVPELRGPLVQAAPHLQIAKDGRCRLDIPGVARYLVKDGCAVVVDPVVDSAPPDIRVILLGTVLGLLCHQRGLFPLHAACLQIGDDAVALSGSPGAGKSTLAAALVQRGHALLADDVCVIDSVASGGPVVLPAFPSLKLRRDALDLLGVSPHGLEQGREGWAKYHLPVREVHRSPPSPVPLRRLLLLEDESAGPLQEIGRWKGFAAVALLVEQVYRRQPARTLGRERALFDGAVRLAQTVSVHRLARRRGADQLDTAVALVEGLAAS
jgi:hypothetical protein